MLFRSGYDRRVASGVIAASGTLAQIIPPSLVLIILADQLGKSVGDMYKGAFVPGFMLTGFYALFVVGQQFLAGVWRFARYGAANMDTLVGIGTLTAFLYSIGVTAFEAPLARFIPVGHTYYDVTIVVIAFITLGKYLEARSKLRTGDAIQSLLRLQAKNALVLRAGNEIGRAHV